jgi:molybdopterin converting factor small subunit
MTRRIRVLLFATAREAVGSARLDRAAPSEGVALDAFLDGLATDFPRLKPILRTSRIVRNGRYVQAGDTRLRAGDEVAIHPPYSGG